VTVERPPPPEGAVQINAEQMRVLPDRKLAVAEGNVEARYGTAWLYCDHLTLFTDTKDVYAQGRVRLVDGPQVVRADLIHYNVETKKGRFLQGTLFSDVWQEHGRTIEHLAEGVSLVSIGYVTSCDQDPPHCKCVGQRALVFAEEQVVRARHATLFVDRLPLIYLPWISASNRQSPFFFIPGKKKPWGQFALMGYRADLPELPDGGAHEATLRWDWRRHFGWGGGMDYQMDSRQLGKGILKLYYNDLKNRTEPNQALPKGATEKRYRLSWRHHWEPREDTTLVTNLQEFSDTNFRKDFLFREEFVRDDAPASFVSLVTGAASFTFSGLVRKRMNRFETVDEVFPQLTFDSRSRRLGETNLFAQTTLDVANLQTKRAHSENDSDVVRLDWGEQLSYALSWFSPIEVTPRAGIRQTYYTKDQQGGIERPQGKRDVVSGQFSGGVDASLKLFRIFPVTTNRFGLNLSWLRHVLTPTLAYRYVHQPTVPAGILTFSASEGTTHLVTGGVENKLQTKRRGQSVDVARGLVSLPYTFRGNHNKQGGRIGDWGFDLELYPWPWMRLESDWTIPSHFIKGTRDDRLTGWNMDVVVVGGQGELKAAEAREIQAPQVRGFELGARGGIAMLLPQGQWYLGLGHRYSQNDKTEGVVQFDRRLGPKWEIGTFHRLTWKEVAGTSKRFGHLREFQYTLRRDLHDWMAELIYRVDREFGEEVFFTLTLKAYPNLPIEVAESYHQPKMGSQSSPFSPVRQ
jgi:hypothetical protein